MLNVGAASASAKSKASLASSTLTPPVTPSKIVQSTVPEQQDPATTDDDARIPGGASGPGADTAAETAAAKTLSYSDRILQAVSKSRPFPMPEWPGREELMQVARLRVCNTVVSRFQAYAFCELPNVLAQLFDKTVDSYKGDRHVPVHSFLLKPETKPCLVNHLIGIYLVNSYTPASISVTVQLRQMLDELRREQLAESPLLKQRLEVIVISLDRNCPDLFEKVKAEYHSEYWWYLPQTEIISNEKFITNYIEQIQLKYLPALTILTPAGGFVIDANARDDFLKKGRTWFTNLLFAAQQAMYFPEPIRLALGPNECTPKLKIKKKDDKQQTASKVQLPNKGRQ